jgi:hypothetical protein
LETFLSPVIGLLAVDAAHKALNYYYYYYYVITGFLFPGPLLLSQWKNPTIQVSDFRL